MPKSEPTPAVASANPCSFIGLPPIDDAHRDKLAAEMDAAPPDAVWPADIGSWLRLRAAVRACRS